MRPSENTERRGSSRARTRWAALLACGLLAAMIAFLVGRTPRTEQGAEARNMDRALAARAPDIVVLGNSIAAAAIDEELLSRELNAAVTVLTVPHSEAPAWYAVLKNRVNASGYRPRVVIVPTLLYNLLGVGLGWRSDDERLLGQMSTHEPVLESKVFDRSANPILHRARRNRRTFRRLVTWSGPYLAMGLAPGPGGSLWVRGRARTERAMGRVFAVANMAFGRGLLKGFEAPDPRDIDRLPAVGDGLVGDLLDEAHSHDSQVLVVRIPASPTAARADPVTPAQERALVQFLNDRGAGYLDFRNLRLTPDDFRDPFHLDDSGQQRVTSQIAAVLQRWGSEGTLDIPQARLPMAPPTLSRTGAPPPSVVLEPTRVDHPTCHLEVHAPSAAFFADERLAPLGYRGGAPLLLVESGKPLRSRPASRSDCRPGEFVARGEAIRFHPWGGWPWSSYALEPVAGPEVRTADGQALHWVLPGTQLNLSFDEGWPPDRGPFVVHVAAQRFGDGDAEARVRATGAGAAPLAGFGGLLRARLEGPGPAGPWELTLSSPADGPWVALHAVSVGAGPHERRVLAYANEVLGPMVPVLGTMPWEQELHWASDPRPLPDAVRWPRVGRGPGSAGRMAVPELAHLADNVTRKCSPLVVYDEEEPLPLGHTRCEVAARQPGTFCHKANSVVFRPLDGSDPVTNGRRYSLRLRREAARFCLTETWLYPGDNLQMNVPAEALRAFYRGANLLTLSGLVASRKPRDAQLVVEVSVAGEVVQRTPISSAAVEADVAALPLDRIPPTSREVAIRLINPKNGPFVLIRKTTLIEATREDLETLRQRRARWEAGRGG